MIRTAPEVPMPIDLSVITEILPHRYPFLLLDRIVEMDFGKRAVGYKNLTADEAVFMGHFPDLPILPGVYMIEALAQLGGTVILQRDEYKRKMAYLAGVDNMKFRRPVIPGDRLMMEVEVTRRRSSLGWIAGTASVDGKVVCSGELMFSVSHLTPVGMDASILVE